MSLLHCLPKLDTSNTASGAKANGKSKVAEMQQYLQQLEKSHAETRSVVESITGVTQKISQNADKGEEALIRLTKRRRHNKRLALVMNVVDHLSACVRQIQKKIANPLNRRLSMLPVDDEHHRLAKRLATLDFPLEACVEALAKQIWISKKLFRCY